MRAATGGRGTETCWAFQNLPLHPQVGVCAGVLSQRSCGRASFKRKRNRRCRRASGDKWRNPMCVGMGVKPSEPSGAGTTDQPVPKLLFSRSDLRPRGGGHRGPAQERDAAPRAPGRWLRRACGEGSGRGAGGRDERPKTHRRPRARGVTRAVRRCARRHSAARGRERRCGLGPGGG